ncbi:MAG: phytanoyl-CoA dioxygenase family protein [Myxococcota bacterium]
MLRSVDGQRGGEVLQSMLELVWMEWKSSRFHGWTQRFAAALIGGEATLWYNQILDKPPLIGAPTGWHQDAALLGTEDGERLISCWMPLHAVGVDEGCMHFLDEGHQDGILDHPRLGALPCSRGFIELSAGRVVACPLPAGGVTFHHGLTPHMTRANRSPRWRQAVIQRFFIGDPPGSRRTAST